jgi:hypothetical protein
MEECAMSGLAFWFPPVGTFGIALAVAGFIVSIIGFKGWWRFGLASACVLLGIGEIVSIVKAEAAHSAEVEQQHSDVERLRNDLRIAETARQVDDAYLKAKVEDYSQFGPALLTLARTAEKFQQKQYETKVQTNKELRDMTMDVVKRLRVFSAKYRALDQEVFDKERAARVQQYEVPGKELTESERRQSFLSESRELWDLSNRKENEFKSDILQDAIYVRDELRRRKTKEPEMTPMQKSEVNIVFRGILSGPYPEEAVADYLEQMAKQLPMK